MSGVPGWRTVLESPARKGTKPGLSTFSASPIGLRSSTTVKFCNVAGVPSGDVEPGCAS